MELTPRRVARYRNDAGGQWDTRHYDDENSTFVDTLGTQWRLVALTTQTYADVRNARAELDALELEVAR